MSFRKGKIRGLRFRGLLTDEEIGTELMLVRHERMSAHSREPNS